MRKLAENAQQIQICWACDPHQADSGENVILVVAVHDSIMTAKADLDKLIKYVETVLFWAFQIITVGHALDANTQVPHALQDSLFTGINTPVIISSSVPLRPWTKQGETQGHCNSAKSWTKQ